MLEAAAMVAFVVVAVALRAYLSSFAMALITVEALAGSHVFRLGLIFAWLRWVGDFCPLA